MKIPTINLSANRQSPYNENHIIFYMTFPLRAKYRTAIPHPWLYKKTGAKVYLLCSLLLSNKSQWDRLKIINSTLSKKQYEKI